MNISEKLLKEVLSEQITTVEILERLKEKGIFLNGRQWRKFVREYNKMFATRDRYIASDTKGYYLTTSKKQITRTAMNKFKVGLSMIKNAKADLKELESKDQLSLLEEDVDMYDLLMKMKEI